TAHAIYLYEKGDNTFEVRTNRLWLIKKYHAKIKILDPKGFSWADVAIPYYHANGSSEKVLGIRAITHNGSVKHSVLKESIFDVDSSENWSMIKFTFPQVELGSILEYTYEIQSPYMFHLNGWSFQESIPKLYSQYNAKIPGLYAYNRALYGDLELSVNF